MGKKGARKGMDDDEIFGAAIIGFATGTLTREFDRRGASNGSNRHDFDLLTSDGKSVVGALEVTAWRGGNILGLLKASRQTETSGMTSRGFAIRGPLISPPFPAATSVSAHG